MSFILIWDKTAIDSFITETEFILLKWNFVEVQKFKILVDQNLETLSKNPEIGVLNSSLNVYSLVISKQTTFYYSFNSKKEIIELHVFWNNLKNPEDLSKLL